VGSPNAFDQKILDGERRRAPWLAIVKTGEGLKQRTVALRARVQTIVQTLTVPYRLLGNFCRNASMNSSSRGHGNRKRISTILFPLIQQAAVGFAPRLRTFCRRPTPSSRTAWTAAPPMNARYLSQPFLCLLPVKKLLNLHHHPGLRSHACRWRRNPSVQFQSRCRVCLRPYVESLPPTSETAARREPGERCWSRDPSQTRRQVPLPAFATHVLWPPSSSRFSRRISLPSPG